MYTVLEWLQSTSEARMLGWNWQTIVTCCAIGIALIQAWSVHIQRMEIEARRSLDSVDVPMFLCTGCYFLMFFYYGIHKDGLAIVVNGAQGFLYVTVFIAFWKYRTVEMMTWKVIAVGAVSVLMIPIMIIIQNKESFLMFALAILLGALAKQARTILKNDSMGAVSVTYVATFLVSCVFWLAYATAVGEWPLQVFNSIAIVIFIAMLKPYVKSKLKLFF